MAGTEDRRPLTYNAAFPQRFPPMTLLTRRQTVPVRIGHVTVGGGQPVVVQSMTNTDTADIEATALQVRALALAGS